MRIAEKKQLQLGDLPISEIEIDFKSRDDIPAVLLGLQHVHSNQTIRENIFSILEDHCTTKISQSTGRQGMTLWNILVLAVLRVSLNIDYDRLQSLANDHKTIRNMLGHGGIFDSDHYYCLQTIRDNVMKIPADAMRDINVLIVQTGHDYVEHDANAPLHGRADSYVVETNVDYPTDVKLTVDALRSAIRIVVMLCGIFRLTSWREHKSMNKKIKKLARKVGKSKKSRPKSKQGKEEKEKAVQEAYQEFMSYALYCVDKIETFLTAIPTPDVVTGPMIAEIKMFRDFAKLQINQMYRRVIMEERIPNNEKIFSVFEEYTEWISKGKAGVKVEFGLKVCILEDQYRFVLYHRIMQDEEDSGIAIEFIEIAQKLFPNLRTCSFDKGFHNPKNQKKLAELLDMCVLPKKGKRNVEEKKREHQEEFIKARHQHSAVESAINALEAHGLNRCPDRGHERFYNYVALGVVGRNLHRLGCLIRAKAQEDAKKEAVRLRRAA